MTIDHVPNHIRYIIPWSSFKSKKQTLLGKDDMFCAGAGEVGGVQENVPGPGRAEGEGGLPPSGAEV